MVLRGPGSKILDLESEISRIEEDISLIVDLILITKNEQELSILLLLLKRYLLKKIEKEKNS